MRQLTNIASIGSSSCWNAKGGKDRRKRNSDFREFQIPEEERNKIGQHPSWVIAIVEKRVKFVSIEQQSWNSTFPHCYRYDYFKESNKTKHRTHKIPSLTRKWSNLAVHSRFDRSAQAVTGLIKLEHRHSSEARWLWFLWDILIKGNSTTLIL